MSKKTEKVDFTDVKWTMLVTLYMRALDSRTKGSILHDHAAADALGRIDYNRRWAMWSTALDRYTAVLRAKQLDDWATEYLSRHPDASVLHLGCGLDSRAFRLDLPGGVHWFDVDLPEVIELRRRLYPERDGYRMIASSVVEEEWLHQVPADRPTLVIGEGLLMYLAPDDVDGLLRRITDRFTAGGELLFDGAKPWAISMSNLLFGAAGMRMGWAIRDGQELERLNPQLRFVTAMSPLTRYLEIPLRGFRLMHRAVCAIPAYRDALRLYRFEF
jgi:methyltransferase (TIGR00027 family)